MVGYLRSWEIAGMSLKSSLRLWASCWDGTRKGWCYGEGREMMNGGASSSARFIGGLTRMGPEGFDMWTGSSKVQT
jgi:hypothetical protein